MEDDFTPPDKLSLEEYEVLCARMDQLINNWPEKNSAEHGELLAIHFIIEEYQLSLARKFKYLCFSSFVVIFAFFSILFAIKIFYLC